MNHHRRFKKLAAVVLGLVFLGAGLGLLSTLYRSQQEDQAFQDLARKIIPSTDPIPYREDAPTEGEVLAQYQALYQENPDLAGWIQIDGTNINYPVMFTPGEIEYYIHRAFDGTYSASGVPFIGYQCSLIPRSDNLVVYGHNMKNGTMFHDLLNYAREDFYREHPIVSFDTLHQTGEYEIAAAFYTEIYPADAEGVFRYYTFTEFSDPQQFEFFREQIEQLALYDTGLELAYGDQLLTLSTCSYHTEQGRFVVVAKRIG